MFKNICSIVLLMFCLNVTAQVEKEKPLTQEQLVQINALKNAIQKEVWGVILMDTFELQQEELKEGIIFKEYKGFNASKYQNLMVDICVENKQKTCPEIYLTNKKNITVAAMYPNGKMYLNVNMLDRLSENEILFSIAHEMGHFVNNDSFRNTQKIADSIVDNTMIVTDVEKWARASFLLPGMRDFHHSIEDQADVFAIKYMNSRNLKINCNEMFSKMTNNEQVSTDQHATVDVRCNKIDSLLTAK